MASLLRMSGLLVYVLGGLIGLFVCLGIIHDLVGTMGVVISLVFFPVAITVAPWIPLVMDGDWSALLLVYGSGIVGTVMTGLASSLERPKAEVNQGSFPVDQSKMWVTKDGASSSVQSPSMPNPQESQWIIEESAIAPSTEVAPSRRTLPPDDVFIDAKRILLRYGAPYNCVDMMTNNETIYLARAIAKSALPDRETILRQLLIDRGYLPGTVSATKGAR